MTPKLKKLIILLLIVGVLFVVYAVFIKKDPTTENLVDTGSALSADAQVIGNQISQALLRIEQIKLDKSIFSNPIYTTLVDRSEPITEEPIGRTNPFAPIGDVSVSSSVRATSSTSSTSNIPPSQTTPPAPTQAPANQGVPPASPSN
jgi:hypothetical protein